ncbi:leucine-rich repeat transmembrane protein FLRT2 [Lates japonicus]|uniref:Leucine-rich repeat transmembrane protein FLRT2 n=1 Tax=Lates japonicus TaxID=270547 RepID=A0AAD3MSX3_LATJO|nr:leucine-rich repeat transmembrane protein FLRT2 [Lates japonicus]
MSPLTAGTRRGGLSECDTPAVPPAGSNLLTDEGIAPGTSQDLANLRELALARTTHLPPLHPASHWSNSACRRNQIRLDPVAPSLML